MAETSVSTACVVDNAFDTLPGGGGNSDKRDNGDQFTLFDFWATFSVRFNKVVSFYSPLSRFPVFNEKKISNDLCNWKMLVRNNLVNILSEIYGFPTNILNPCPEIFECRRKKKCFERGELPPLGGRTGGTGRSVGRRTSSRADVLLCNSFTFSSSDGHSLVLLYLPTDVVVIGECWFGLFRPSLALIQPMTLVLERFWVSPVVTFSWKKLLFPLGITRSLIICLKWAQVDSDFPWNGPRSKVRWSFKWKPFNLFRQGQLFLVFSHWWLVL